jgi:apolipoprotein N-acyltransferase
MSTPAYPQPETAVQVQEQPRRPEAPPGPRRPRLLLAALASGGMLYACHFPLAQGWWLAWVALVPLLCLVRADASPRLIYPCAWLAGLVYYWPAISWMSRAAIDDYAMVYAWMLLSTYCSLYVPLAVWLLRRLERRTALPLVVTVPAVWVGLEFIRSFFLTGFAWYFLGHTQHQFLAIIQITDLAGVYAVTALVAAVNAWVFEFLYAQPWFGKLWRLSRTTRPATSPRGLLVQGACVVVVWATSLGYGLWRLGQDDFAVGPRVALLQSNLDQRLRNSAADPEQKKEEARRSVQSIRDHFGELREVATKERPDLIVWPEASYPDHWVELQKVVSDQEVRPEGLLRLGHLQRQVEEEARRSETRVLLGIHVSELGITDPERRYSSAMLFSPEGRFEGRYDKMHRVPFGEYVPLRELAPGLMKKLTPYSYDYSIRPGEHFTRFPLGPYHFGVLICFEDTDPFMARRYLVPDKDGGGPVDFLVNMSNDGWFDGSSEHDEHLAICRFRAVETRRAVVRSVNMGISAVIDGNGRVLKETPPIVDLVGNRFIKNTVERWHIPADPEQVTSLPISEWSEYKQRAGVLTATIPLDDRASLYTQWGDWLPFGCWILVGLGFFWRPPAKPLGKAA